MPEIIKDLLTTYWSQTILLIGGFSYIMKLSFDLRSKKIELKYSLFEQNRIGSIMKFLNAYLELEQNYKLIPEGRLKLSNIYPENYDEMFLKKNGELYSAYFFLKMYLDPLELARYADLIIEMRNISDEIKKAYIKSEPENLEAVEKELKNYIVERIGINNENFKFISKYFREFSVKPNSLKLR